MARLAHRTTLVLASATAIALAGPALAAAAPASVPAATDGQTGMKVKRVKPSTPVSFYFGLKRDDASARAAALAAGDPSSAQYRQFPTRSQIQQKYGASAQTISQLTAVLKNYGLTMEVDGTGVFATVNGTARGFGRLLGTPIVKVVTPLPQAGSATTLTPNPPSQSPAQAAAVQRNFQKRTKGLAPELVALDPTYKFSPLQLSGVVPVGYVTSPETDVNAGSPAGCLPTERPELSELAYSFNELTTAYGLTEVAEQPELGQSVRMAILAEGSGFSEGSLARSQECFELPALDVERAPVPGLESALPEGDEGDLDVQVAQSALPVGSSVTVIESPGLDPLLFLSYATLFNLPEPVDVASSSYGSCEPSLKGADTLALSESLLLRVALSGTSVFSAAGDSGSSDCEAQDPTIKELSVDYPASSTWVTSVGGTRLTVNPDNTRGGEVVWNDKQLPSGEYPKQQAGAGGGGQSILFAAPSWQEGADTKTKQRAVPDMAAHASEVPAWTLTFGQGFTPVGGTSAATPLVSSGFAMIAAQQRVDGQPPLGPVQPWLYQLHQQKPEAFYDIVKGDNDLFKQGCCTARPGYDEASGLGAPVFPQLANSVPAPGGAS